MTKIFLNEENRNEVFNEITARIKKHDCNTIYVECNGKEWAIRIENRKENDWKTKDIVCRAKNDVNEVLYIEEGSAHRLLNVGKAVEKIIDLMFNLKEEKEMKTIEEMVNDMASKKMFKEVTENINRDIIEARKHISKTEKDMRMLDFYCNISKFGSKEEETASEKEFNRLRAVMIESSSIENQKVLEEQSESYRKKLEGQIEDLNTQSVSGFSFKTPLGNHDVFIISLRNINSIAFIVKGRYTVFHLAEFDYDNYTTVVDYYCNKLRDSYFENYDLDKLCFLNAPEPHLRDVLKEWTKNFDKETENVA